MAQGSPKPASQTVLRGNQRRAHIRRASVAGPRRREPLRAAETALAYARGPLREQIGLINQIQALMSVIEGYSDFVMDRIGKEMLATYEYMKREV